MFRLVAPALAAPGPHHASHLDVVVYSCPLECDPTGKAEGTDCTAHCLSLVAPLTVATRALQRSRTPSDKDDDSDDDISLVSRTPSPEPDKLDDDPNEYDRYHRGFEREVITVETKLKATNIGHMMLSKMGWKEGQGLGVAGEGMSPSCLVNVEISFAYMDSHS